MICHVFICLPFRFQGTVYYAHCPADGRAPPKEVNGQGRAGCLYVTYTFLCTYKVWKIEDIFWRILFKLNLYWHKMGYYTTLWTFKVRKMEAIFWRILFKLNLKKKCNELLQYMLHIQGQGNWSHFLAQPIFHKSLLLKKWLLLVNTGDYCVLQLVTTNC